MNNILIAKVRKATLTNKWKKKKRQQQQQSLQ